MICCREVEALAALGTPDADDERAVAHAEMASCLAPLRVAQDRGQRANRRRDDAHTSRAYDSEEVGFLVGERHDGVGEASGMGGRAIEPFHQPQSTAAPPHRAPGGMERRSPDERPVRGFRRGHHRPRGWRGKAPVDVNQRTWKAAQAGAQLGERAHHLHFATASPHPVRLVLDVDANRRPVGARSMRGVLPRQRPANRVSARPFPMEACCACQANHDAVRAAMRGAASPHPPVPPGHTVPSSLTTCSRRTAASPNSYSNEFVRATAATRFCPAHSRQGRVLRVAHDRVQDTGFGTHRGDLAEQQAPDGEPCAGIRRFREQARRCRDPATAPSPSRACWHSHPA